MTAPLLGPAALMHRYRHDLQTIIRSTDWFMYALTAVRQCDPPDWLVGGGVIRNLVWDHLHGFAEPTVIRDVDVAFFDPADLTRERDEQVEAALDRLDPDVPWQAKNQAAVHQWYERRFGFCVDPLTSSSDAIGTWPETATSVAVRLLDDDNLMIVAPCGLDDLFQMVLRRNPRRITRELFEQRLLEKRILDLWPSVQVVHD